MSDLDVIYLSAIEEFVLGEPRFPESWRNAQSTHQFLYGTLQEIYNL